MDLNTSTIIEFRDENVKLSEGHFDETLYYIQRNILSWVEGGCTEFTIIKNDRNYDFHWLSNYQ